MSSYSKLTESCKFCNLQITALVEHVIIVYMETLQFRVSIKHYLQSNCTNTVQ